MANLHISEKVRLEPIFQNRVFLTNLFIHTILSANVLQINCLGKNLTEGGPLDLDVRRPSFNLSRKTNSAFSDRFLFVSSPDGLIHIQTVLHDCFRHPT